jgi:hypothetical protein
VSAGTGNSRVRLVRPAVVALLVAVGFAATVGLLAAPPAQAATAAAPDCSGNNFQQLFNEITKPQCLVGSVEGLIGVGSASSSPSKGSKGTPATSNSSAQPPPGCGGNGVEQAYHDATDPKCFVASIFGVPGNFNAATIAEWVIKIPAYLTEQSGAMAGGIRFTQAAGLAMLFALVTFVAFNLLVTGIGGGGTTVVDTVPRAAFAGLAIVGFPWLADVAVQATQSFSYAVDPVNQLNSFSAILPSFAQGGLSIVTSIVLDLAVIVVAFGLIVIKLGLGAGLVVCFLAAPITIALWAVPALSGPAQYPLRMIGMILSTQVIWALCLFAIGVLYQDTAGWSRISGGGGFLDQVLKPLIDVGVMWGMMRVPAHSARAWNVHRGHGRGGLLGGLIAVAALRGAAGVASSSAAPAAGRHAGGARAGGTRGYSGGHRAGSPGTVAGTVGRAMLASAAAGRGAGHGGARGGSSANGRRGGPSGRHGAPSPRSPSRSSGDDDDSAGGPPPGQESKYARGPAGEYYARSHGMPTGFEDPPAHGARLAEAMDGDRASVTAEDAGRAVEAVAGWGGGFYQQPLERLMSQTGQAPGDSGDRRVSSVLADVAAGAEPLGLGGHVDTLLRATPQTRRAGAAKAGMNLNGSGGGSSNGSRGTRSSGPGSAPRPTVGTVTGTPPARRNSP